MLSAKLQLQNGSENKLNVHRHTEQCVNKYQYPVYLYCDTNQNGVNCYTTALKGPETVSANEYQYPVQTL